MAIDKPLQGSAISFYEIRGEIFGASELSRKDWKLTTLAEWIPWFAIRAIMSA